MITIDQAAKIVKDLNNSGNTELAMDLFAFFEERLNPHPAKINNEWNDDSVIWISNFAAACGYLIARNVAIKQAGGDLKKRSRLPLAKRSLIKLWKDRALKAESEAFLAGSELKRVKSLLAMAEETIKDYDEQLTAMEKL